MASLNGQTIASSYEQLLHVDRDGGGNSTTLVDVKDGDNGTTFALKLATDKIQVNGSSDLDGAVTINESSAAVDFRVESDDNTHMIFVDGSEDLVGIGTQYPIRPLGISYGAAKTSTSTAYAMSIQSNESSGQAALQFYAVGGASAAARKFQLQTTEVGVANAGIIEFQPDGGVVSFANSVGIGTTSPGYLTELRVNDTTVDTPRLVIRQLGTGDSSLAFQMSDSPYGFVMGVDNSDSDRFKISTGVGDVDSSPRFEIDPGGTTIHRYTGAENIVQIHSGVGSSTTGTSQIYFSSKDEHGGNTHQSYIKSTIDGTSSTTATKMTFHNRDSGGTVQEYMAIKADGLVQLNENNVGSAGTSNKFLSVGGELSTQFDETNVGTMSGMIISNEYTNASNQAGTACGIVFTHHSASSGISYIASKSGANGGDRSALFFGTRGSGGVEERLRLEDNGEIFLGKGGDGYVRHYEIGGSNYWYLYATNSDKYNFNYNASGTPEMVISTSGNVTILGSLTEGSDIRLKENVETIPNALSKVNQMRGVSYNKIGEEKVRIGMVADEVEKIIPELVRIEPNEDVEGLENLKSLAYAETVAVLVEAIKELSSQVTDLKKEIEDLKG